MYIFKALISQNQCHIETNMKQYKPALGGVYYYTEKLNAEDDMVKKKNKNKGVGIRETSEYIEIYNDPYCSVPLYILKTQNGVCITSIYEKIETENMKVDLIGFYETLLYESALYDRTLYEEVKQLPAASYVKINKHKLDYNIENYWNFDISENRSINSEEQAIDLVWNKLCSIFSQYNEKKLIMGISGGLDSRLSLCVMNSVLDMKKIEAFTFGHSKGILDYKLACETCAKLEAPIIPRFYKLSGNAYLESMELPLKTSGGVGINHSHIYWCLSQMDTQGKTLVSNYYSDAVMGYDCLPIEYEDVVENCAYYKKLHSNKFHLDEEMVSKIEKDIRKITDRRTRNSNFSCYDEFIYLVERNPKFHIKLSYAFSERVPVVLPYAEYGLLETVISLPLKYRYRKQIEHLILQDKMGKLRDISSTRYAGVDKEEEKFESKCYYNFGFLLMRITNLCNSGLNIISRGTIQIPNPYITENQLAIFNRYFAKYQKNACNELYKNGLISKELFNKLKGRPKRTAEAQLCFGIIGLWSVIK